MISKVIYDYSMGIGIRDNIVNGRIYYRDKSGIITVIKAKRIYEEGQLEEAEKTLKDRLEREVQYLIN